MAEISPFLVLLGLPSLCIRAPGIYMYILMVTASGGRSFFSWKRKDSTWKRKRKHQMNIHPAAFNATAN